MRRSLNGVAGCVALTLVFFQVPIKQPAKPKHERLSDTEHQIAVGTFPRPNGFARFFHMLFSTNGIRPSFTWSMPSRYGRDENRNSLIDLPNSFEYVHNAAACPCVDVTCPPKSSPAEM
jgi:hypothetical protein